MSGKPFDLSVIVVTWNRPGLLRACLSSLARAIRASGLACEVWVVDNGSTAGDAAVVEAEFPEVNLIRSAINLGFARANNLALKQATGRYYLLLNNDALVPPDSLRSIVGFMDVSPGVGIAGASLVRPQGDPEQCSGEIQTPSTALADALHITPLLSSLRLSRRDHSGRAASVQAKQVGYVCGAFLIIRRETVQAIGLLDERFDFYYEEVDWCARARDAGWQVVLLPHIRILHCHSLLNPLRAAALHAVGLESRRRFLHKRYGRIASLMYRAAVPVGALLLTLRSALPHDVSRRSLRVALAASALSWAFRGAAPWPPSGPMPSSTSST